MKLPLPSHALRFGRPISPWHWWLAWHPATTWDGRLVWLVPVLRRTIQKHDYLDGGDDHWSEYHFPWGYASGQEAK